MSRTSPSDEAVQRSHAQLGFRLASMIVLSSLSTLTVVLVPEFQTLTLVCKFANHTVPPLERTSSVCFQASPKKSFLRLFLFYIANTLLEPAGTRDVDSQCQPWRNKSSKCVIDRARRSFKGGDCTCEAAQVIRSLSFFSCFPVKLFPLIDSCLTGWILTRVFVICGKPCSSKLRPYLAEQTSKWGEECW